MGMVFYPATRQIIITRGDTGSKEVTYTYDDEPYELQTGDRINFGVKKDYTDRECLIEKTYTVNPFALHLDPQDTKMLNFGDYVWDMEVVLANGYTETFASGIFTVTEEVV